MSKAKPLTAEQCEAAREAMLTGHSLSKISRCAGVVATISSVRLLVAKANTFAYRRNPWHEDRLSKKV